MTASLPPKDYPIGKVLHICENCKHHVLANLNGSDCISYEDCECIKCIIAKTRRLEKTRAEFRQRILDYLRNQPTISCDEISIICLEDLVAMYTLVRSWASEDLTHLLPLRERQELFWPTSEKSISSLISIHNCRMVQVDSANSPISDFSESEHDGIKCHLPSVALLPAITSNSEAVLSLSEVIVYLSSLLEGGLTLEQKSQLPSLMNKIAVEECVQFYAYLLDKYKFGYEIGEKTKLAFEGLLKQTSVSQILVCIWQSVRDAAAFSQTSYCRGRKHAFNSIQGRLRDAANRRINSENNWSGFDRNIHCPRSEVSFCLYELLGFHEDVGLYERLEDIEIPPNWIMP